MLGFFVLSLEMHQKFTLFILAVVMLYSLSEAKWMDYLCNNRDEIEQMYNGSALVLLPADFKDHENSTWKYRKLCLYNENEVGKCTEIGVLMNGTEYPKKLRVGRASSDAFYAEETFRIRTRRDASTGFFFKETVKSQNVAKREVPADLPTDFFYGESTCKVATKLKTAEVMCKIFPSSIKCKSFCVYGATFDDAITKIHSCVYKENRWTKEFEECKPFVDCTLKLVSPGSVKCIGNDIMKPPYCQVACDEYEDKAETKKQAYTCLANGKWQPPLPHCVEPRGINLVKAPPVTEHKVLTYP